MFIIRNKVNGAYLTGGRGGFKPVWNSDINKARIYTRKCDARNSIVGHFNSYYNRYKLTNTIQSKDLEVVPVTVSIHDVNEPNVKVDISPEILERATRYMMNEQAVAGGAPESLVRSLEDLDTNSVVKLVTTLYGRK